jgi:hypothetical protein
MVAFSNFAGVFDFKSNSYTPTVSDSRNSRYYVGKASGTAYAAANVAGYIACLMQVNPALAPADALSTVTQYALVNQLTVNIEGFGINKDLNGANNLLLHSVFPEYNENIIATVHNSTVTSVAVGEHFNIVITNGDPFSYFTYTGSAKGKGQLDANGNATINTYTLANIGDYVYRFYFPLTNHAFTLKIKVQTARDVTSSNIIYADDFDRIQSRVKYLIQDLYGVSPASNAVTATIVTATSWTNVYKDIENAYIHQNNQPITLLTVDTRTRVTAQEVNSLTKIVDNLITNFDQAAQQQLALVNTQSINTNTNNIYDSYVRTYHWTTSTSVPNAARNFFNLGGYVKVNFSNPYLGDQTGYFTLTDYISGSGSISLPIPGGNVISKLSIQDINGNTATIQTIVAPNPGNIALATGTVQMYASTNATGGIAAPVPSPITDAPLAQGQLIVNPVSQYINLTGNNVNSYSFTVRNSSPNAITVTKINVIDDNTFAPLNTIINTSVPFTVPARANGVDGTVALSVSFQNVTSGGTAGLHNNYLQLISDGVNPVLDIAVPIVTKFGIATDSLNLVVTRATSATIIPIAYAGTITSFSGVIKDPSTGFQLINPGVNNTYFTLDDTPGKLTMGLLLLREFFTGLRSPSTTGAIKSPYPDPVLVVDVASIPNKTTSTQITYTAYSSGNIGTCTSTVSVTPNVVDKHLGSWLSPQNMCNGVIGFSYDILNGERYITVGFGMGAGGSPDLRTSNALNSSTQYASWGYGAFSNYALPQLGSYFQSPITTATLLTALLAWDTSTNTTSVVTSVTPDVLVSQSNTYNSPFLQTYGVWSGFANTATSLVTTATFLVRDSGDYSFYFGLGARAALQTANDNSRVPGTTGIQTGTIYIDNIEIQTLHNAATTDRITTSTQGSVYLNAGLHSVVIKGSNADPTTANSIAGVITDFFGHTIWSTLENTPPAWAEITRIRLQEDGIPRSYQAIPNLYSGNVAAGTTYSTFFENQSIVTIHDNGFGQLSISLNKVASGALNADFVNATLLNAPYLFYYGSNAENQVLGNKRFNNYQTVGQYVRYFTGFDQYGNVTTKNVLAPGYIAPPTLLLAAIGGSEQHYFTFWQKVLISAVVAFAVYALVTFVAAIVTDTAFLYLLANPEVWVVVVAVVVFVAVFQALGDALKNVCFIGGTLVCMADGTVKQIQYVKAGDLVYNYDKTKINKVKHLEITVTKELIGLYSPDKDIAPFATLNHPLYVNGKLSSLAPDQIYNAYPWLGMTSQIYPERSGPLHPGELMYNLYLDGDNTYIANGYGTNSISGDGGALRMAMEYGYLTQDRIQEMFLEYIEAGVEVAYGGYLFNKYFGKVLETIKLGFVVKLAAMAFDQPKDSTFRKMANKVFKFIGKQAIKRQQKQLKK